MYYQQKTFNLYFLQKPNSIFTFNQKSHRNFIFKKTVEIQKKKTGQNNRSKFSFLNLKKNAYNEMSYLPLLQFKIPDFLNIQRLSFKYFLQKGLIDEFQKYTSIKNSDQTLEILFYPEHYKLNRPKWTPKQAILKKKSYSSQLYLPVQLSNYKTEEIKVQWVLLANLPLMTKHGHFILNGCPRVLMNQVVRSPGVYFRKTLTKNQKTVYSADFIAQRGSWLRLEVDTKKGDIWAKLKKTPKIPIFVLLRALGLTLPILNNSIDFGKLRYLLQFKKEIKGSKKIKEFLGPGINNSMDILELRVLLKNLKKYLKPKPIKKINKLGKTRKKKEWLTPFVCATYFQSLIELSKKLYPQKKFLELDPKLSQKFLFRKFQNPRTYDLSVLGRARINKKLGLTIPQEHTVLTSQDVLFACLFLMDLLQGLVIADDIDDLKNRKIKPSGELIQTQLATGLIRLEKNIREKLKQPKQDSYSFSNLFNVKTLNQSLREFFGTNPLSQLMDQTNALSELTHKRRLSSLGPGGINRETAGMAIRGIHPTHYGRICPIETPEGQNAGLVNSFTVYSHLNPKGFIETPFYKTYKGFILKNKKPFLFSSDQEKNYILAPGDIKTSLFDFLPKNISIPARQFTEFKRVSRNLINFTALSPIQMISVATSLIPFLEHNDGNRALMGSNMQRQAVPTVRPSKPIVGTGLESKVISDVGHGLQVQQSGFVSYVDGKAIIIYSKNLEKPHSFFENKLSRGSNRLSKNESFYSLFELIQTKKNTKQLKKLKHSQKKQNPQSQEDWTFVKVFPLRKKLNRYLFKSTLIKSAKVFHFKANTSSEKKNKAFSKVLGQIPHCSRQIKTNDRKNFKEKLDLSLNLINLSTKRKDLVSIFISKKIFFLKPNKLYFSKAKLKEKTKTPFSFLPVNLKNLDIDLKTNYCQESLNKFHKYNFNNHYKPINNRDYNNSILPFQIKTNRIDFNNKQLFFIYKCLFLNDFLGQFELARVFYKKKFYSKSKKNFRPFLSKSSLFLINQLFHQKLLVSYCKLILDHLYSTNQKKRCFETKHRQLIEFFKKYETNKLQFIQKTLKHSKSQLNNPFWFKPFLELNFRKPFEFKLQNKNQIVSKKKEFFYYRSFKDQNKKIFINQFYLKFSNLFKYQKQIFVLLQGKEESINSSKTLSIFLRTAVFDLSKVESFLFWYFNFYQSLTNRSPVSTRQKFLLGYNKNQKKFNPFPYVFSPSNKNNELSEDFLSNYQNSETLNQTILYKFKNNLNCFAGQKKIFNLLGKRNCGKSKKNSVFLSFPIASSVFFVSNTVKQPNYNVERNLTKQIYQLASLCQVKKTSKNFLKPFVRNKNYFNQLNIWQTNLDRSNLKINCSFDATVQQKKPVLTKQENGFKQPSWNQSVNFSFESNLFTNTLIPQKYILNNYHRSNQSTYMVHRPIVQEGQWVEKGDILADSSASVQGELSIGHNILVGYTPWEGYNFEDAVLISERLIFDDLYTSLHIERYEVEVRDTQFGLEQITNQLPNGKNNYDYLDHNGIAKIGSWVNEGDILVGKIAPIGQKSLTPYENLLYDIIGKEIPKTRDTSLRVPKGVKGRVIHVEIVETNRKKGSENFESLPSLIFPKKKKIKTTIPFPSLFSPQTQKVRSFAFHTSSKQLLCYRGTTKNETYNKLQPNQRSFFNEQNFFNQKIETVSSFEKQNSRFFLNKKKSFTTEMNFFNKNEKLHQNILETKVALLTKNLFFPKLVKKRIFLLETAKTFKLSSKTLKNQLFLKNHEFKKTTLSVKKSPEAKFYNQDKSIRLKNIQKLGLATLSRSKPKEQTDQFQKKGFSGPQKVHIYLAEKRKLQIGDKIAGRHGNKGIISNILPRQDMPYLPDGTPLDIVLNPLGVPSRMNVGQIFECLLGIAGYYLKQNYKIQPFDELYGCEASRSLVYSKLYEARIKTCQDWLFNPNYPGKIRLFDGRNGECFEQPVTVGVAYILKLIHLVDDKIHARSTGPYSLVTQQPLRGRSKQGGQRVGEMEVWALEGFGAAYILQEILTIKSDDLKGRNQIMNSILNNEPLIFGLPESFKVLVRELQSLCLDIAIYKYEENGLPTKINIDNFW